MEIIETEENSEESQLYEVHIDNFDGPLDILWDLIKKSKVDITEISISQITEQYINYLKVMETLNVKIATSFIWMASELLFYKSKALLPTEAMEDEYFTPPLPPELIAKLLEYKRFQKTAQLLREQYDFQADAFNRSPEPVDDLGEAEQYLEVSLFDLLKAFTTVLEHTPTAEIEEIVFDEILVSDRIEHITTILKEKDMVNFYEFFSPAPVRAEIVATFLAILEMAKTRMIKIMQNKVFGDIRISRNFKVDQIS